MKFELTTLLRKNIAELTPYSTARDEYKGKTGVFLDANENPFGSPLPSDYNRYPDPVQLELKEKIGRVKGLFPENIFVGNGSDEAIDLLIRSFCVPGQDAIMVCPPTYGMYEVAAKINDVVIQKVPLLANTFQLDANTMKATIDKRTKLIFICSPNNPTGNAFDRQQIIEITRNFSGLVVVDEAYINFCSKPSMIRELVDLPNLVVLQTLSKAWGLAGLRVGMAFASQQLIDVLNKVKAPYNVNCESQRLAIAALDNVAQVNAWIQELVDERNNLAGQLNRFQFVRTVFPSDANFLLVKADAAEALFHFLQQREVIVRDRSSVLLCDNCLRISVGTSAENKRLIELLNTYKP